MKNIITILSVLVLVGLVGCVPPTGDVITDTTTSDLQQVTLEIEGMTCQSCALGVEYELKQVDGVVDAKVNYKNGLGLVTFDPSKVDIRTVAQASTVYPAKVIKVDFN